MKFLNTEIDWPLDSNVIRRGLENNTFGMVRRNTDGSPRPHQGWDFYAKVGTPLYSVSDGLVKYSGAAGTLGNLLVVSIGVTGKFAAYAHLQHINVQEGDSVKLGQFIGYTGNTGNANNMRGLDEHLHFEVRDTPLPGLGLAGRFSPLKLFGHIPFTEPVLRLRK
jgi:murein DD-endopeptidase MepM/ murein hydrolase activator NlpD